MDLQKEYDDLISQYQTKMRELRVAEKRRRDRSVILFLDRERDVIHNKLRKLGLQIGKDSQDIMLDILASDNDLSEYQLPEFRALRTNKAMEKIDFVFLLDDSGNIQKRFRGNDLYYKHIFPADLGVFIPFGEQENWHLFDCEGYTFHFPDEEERKNRMNRLIAMAGGALQSIEIISYTSFHNATTLFGVACSVENLERVFAVMREHRLEVSISKDFFDKEKINENFFKMLEKDLNYILERELDNYETHKNLVIRLKEYIVWKIPMDSELAKKVNDFFEDYVEKAKYVDTKERVDKEIAPEMELLERSERDYPKESQLPIRDSMRKK